MTRKEISAAIIQIRALQTLLDSGTLDETSAATIAEMKIKNIENLISKKHKYSFCKRKNGLYQTRLPDNSRISAKTLPALQEKLYHYYYDGRDTLSGLFPQWAMWARDVIGVNEKTLYERVSCWKRLYEKAAIANKPIRSIQVKDWEDFFSVMIREHHMTQSGFRDARTVAKQLYAYAIRENIVTVNPISVINYQQYRNHFRIVDHEEDKIRKPFSENERLVILNYLRFQKTGYEMAFEFSLYIPLRIGEIKGIQRQDIDFENNTIRIRRQKLENHMTMKDDLTFEAARTTVDERVKGHTEAGFRTIPLVSGAVDVLKKALRQNPFGKFVFMEYGNPLTTQTADDHIRSVCKACGLQYHPSQQMRFTVASILYRHGMPLTQLQKIMGHTQISTTMHYLRNVASDENEAARIMEEAL